MPVWCLPAIYSRHCEEHCSQSVRSMESANKTFLIISQQHTPSHCLDRRRHRPRFFVLKIIGQRSQRFELNSTQSFLWDISDMANAPRLAQGNRTENMEMNGTAPAQVSLVQLVQSKGPSQTAVVSLSARSELCKIRIPSYQEASCVENKFEFRPRIRKHLVWKTIFFSDQRDSLYCLKYICSNVACAAQPPFAVEI